MEKSEMKQSEYSVVIIGSGVAGLYAALKFAQMRKSAEKILLVTKCPLGESNSRYAQGGIAGVIRINPQDSVDLHTSDTLKAGAGLSDEAVTRYISGSSENILFDLIQNGIKFDSDESGNFAYALAGAHSLKRVLHIGEDSTGRGLIEVLVNKIKDIKKICVMEKSTVVDLIVNSDKKCQGVIIYNKDTNEHEVVYSSAVVIATGGAGQIYKYTTNPYGATGDGIAAAYEAGAEIQDIEFIQFHPTALAQNPNSKNRFLISEAVRGEGAKLINKNNETFMQRYSNKGELASRDIVTRAIFAEMKRLNTDNVFLDTTVINHDKLLKRFPTIAKKCKAIGIDITKTPIPVAPAAHYTMGGVKAEINGKTSINGLYVIGEAASTGLHGANRLATNSLLECVVCAYESARNLVNSDLTITKDLDENTDKIINEYSAPVKADEYDITALKNRLREIMWNNAGIIRNEKSLIKAKNDIEQLKKEFNRNRKCLNLGEYEYRNMLTVAELIIQGAINRKESRGAHFRSDYPKRNETAEHSVIVKEE
ncbi:L-aspartate oxidase [bacterium]|nr:L-aspartate oxidase [bacterium]